MSRKSKNILARINFRFKDKRQLRLIIIGLVVLVILITYLSGPRGTIRLIQEVRKKQELNKEIKELEATKSELDSIKKRLQNDPAYIEKIAREEYNMKKEGEKVIKIEKDSK